MSFVYFISVPFQFIKILCIRQSGIDHGKDQVSSKCPTVSDTHLESRKNTDSQFHYQTFSLQIT